jgi:adenylate cyclase
MSSPPEARIISIRAALVRTFVVLVVALAGALLVLMSVLSSRELEETCRTLVRHAATKVEGELRAYFHPVRAQLLQLRDWGQAGLLPLDGETLMPLLGPVARRLPQVTGGSVTDESGHAVTLMEEPGRVWVREDRAAGMPPGQARFHETDADGEVTRRWQAESDYDAPARPWYQAARPARGQPIWTAAYSFFTSKAPGITTALSFQEPGGAERVVGLHVLLSDVSEFTSSLQVGTNGSAQVMDESGRVLGLPRGERSETPEARARWVLRPIEEVGSRASQAAWSRRFEKAGESDASLLEVNGKRWWVAHQPFDLAEGHRLWIQVVVPEEDFVGRYAHLQNVGLVTTFATMLLAVLMSLGLARAYSEPLEHLAEDADRIRRLELTDTPDIDSHLHEVRELEEALNRMRTSLRSFAKYVPMEVVRELTRQGQDAELGGRHAHLSILFSDIKGFTSFSETMTPTDLTDHMGEYFDRLLGIVRERSGTVDKLIGDAIMAFWGAPVEDPDHARHALEAVLGCQAALAEMGERWEAEGLPRMPTRFGLHTGEVIVGNVGSRERFDFTVLGDAVNLASRVEAINDRYGTWVLATEDFKDAVGDGFEWRWVDRVAVKGREAFVDLVEPLGRSGEVPDEILEAARTYEEAFAATRERRWDDALTILEALGDEPSAASLRRRIEAWKDVPPPEGWQGESRMRSK